jgi:hypothetical protein
MLQLFTMNCPTLVQFNFARIGLDEVEVWTAEAGGWIGQKGSKYATQAASISCIVHNAVFSDVWCGTPTASHQRRFSGSSEIGVLWIYPPKTSSDLQDALKKSIREIARY